MKVFTQGLFFSFFEFTLITIEWVRFRQRNNKVHVG